MLLGLPLAVWIIIFVSLLYTVLWVQVLILHYRGAFRRIWMWEPVIYLPLVAILGIVTLFMREVLLEVYGIASLLVVLMGLSGLLFHIQGIYRYVGGWNLDNIMVGPPPMFPFALAIMGSIGFFVALLWR